MELLGCKKRVLKTRDNDKSVSGLVLYEHIQTYYDCGTYEEFNRYIKDAIGYYKSIKGRRLLIHSEVVDGVTDYHLTYDFCKIIIMGLEEYRTQVGLDIDYLFLGKKAGDYIQTLDNRYGDRAPTMAEDTTSDSGYSFTSPTTNEKVKGITSLYITEMINGIAGYDPDDGLNVPEYNRKYKPVVKAVQHKNIMQSIRLYLVKFFPELSHEVVKEMKDIHQEDRVYILHARDTDLYKVGHSVDVDKRLRALQTASPHTLYVYKTYNCTHAHSSEQSIHRTLSDKGYARTAGEWFSIDTDPDLIVKDILGDDQGQDIQSHYPESLSSGLSNSYLDIGTTTYQDPLNRNKSMYILTPDLATNFSASINGHVAPKLKNMVNHLQRINSPFSPFPKDGVSLEDLQTNKPLPILEQDQWFTIEEANGLLEGDYDDSKLQNVSGKHGTDVKLKVIRGKNSRAYHTSVWKCLYAFPFEIWNPQDFPSICETAPISADEQALVREYKKNYTSEPNHLFD